MITAIEKFATLKIFFNNLRFSFPKLRTSNCRSDITIHHDFNGVDEFFFYIFFFWQEISEELEVEFDDKELDLLLRLAGDDGLVMAMMTMIILMNSIRMITLMIMIMMAVMVMVMIVITMMITSVMMIITEHIYIDCNNENDHDIVNL